MTIRHIKIDDDPDRGKTLLGFELFDPQTGDAIESEHIRLDGWALAKNGRVRKIEVMNGDTLWKIIPLSLACRTAAKQHPGARGIETCGFRASFGTIGLSREFKVDLFAVFHNGSRQRCAGIRGVRQPILTTHRPKFLPLILTSLARTGTTRMMQTLHEHPAIALDANYPFETRSGCYWLHMLKVLSDPSLGKNTFEAEVGTLLPCPMNSEIALRQPNVSEWFGNEYVRRVAEFAQKNIDELYGLIAENERKSSAVYFAEKSLPCHVQWIARDLYKESKEIFLIRDFRDMICSMIAFNHKRGFATFGRETVDSDAEFIRLKLADATRLMETVRSRPESLCVKYEDLILDPVSTLARIAEYLGVSHDTASSEMSQNLGDHTRAKLDFHRTTDNVKESVGRWQRDLSPKLKVLSNQLFAPLLDEAGYNV